ncbi:MAG: anthranilate synthase component I [Gloeomargarita sp. HHBFW_bins_162]
MAGIEYWRNFPLDGRTGSEIFSQLGLEQPVAALLESPPGSNGRYSLCAAGQHWVTPPLEHILPWMAEHLTFVPRAADNRPADLPFTGGWWGWLAYEAVWAWERLPPLAPDPLPFPVAFWFQPDWCAILDHQQEQLHLGACNNHLLHELIQKLNAPLPEPFPELPPSGAVQWQLSPDEYHHRVARVQHHIQAGDIFQANLSVRFAVPTHQHPWRVYQNLTRLNPSPFACYWQTPWGQMVSCSPERLVFVQGDVIETRPIAGTRPRGATPAWDRTLAQELLNHPKERAEHIMLVDLERNDLGRVCRWGSVRVAELFTLEAYSHVMHLVSRIVGKLRPECTPADVFQAVFPGGTITGCPKVRCMEILHTLEPHRRNLFYGSCGYWDGRGRGDWNILIRTLLFPKGAAMAWGQVGAGIVSDSDPQREWRESVHKAQAQFLALGTKCYE